jgi:molybdenum cofactor cytidylyltransferase
LTTTTKLMLEQSALAASHLIIQDETSFDSLPAWLEKHGSVLVTGVAWSEEPKWLGLDSFSMNKLASLANQVGAWMLIEADGARGRSLKGHADCEPVIPAFADLVVPIAGLDVVGEALGPAFVHRPEIVGSLLGLAQGERLEPEHIVRLLCLPEGGLKGVPDGAEVRVLLNKAETPERIEVGLSIAEQLLASPRLKAAVLAHVAHDPPVRQVVSRTAGVILAAGESRRLEQPKQLVEWDGSPLVWHAVQAALKAGLRPVVVVVGAKAESVIPVLEGEPVSIVHNPEWTLGQSSSLKRGLAEVEEIVEAVVVLLSDMPFVNAELVRALVQEHRRTLSPLVAPYAGGRRANPVLFDRATFSALRSVEGDQGGRTLFQQFPVALVEWDESILCDIDTPDDLDRLKGRT